MEESKNYVLACNKIDSFKKKQLTRVEVPAFNCTVEQLAESITELMNLDKDTFDMICFGKTLELSKSLDSYGINNGIIVYLIQKRGAVFKEPQIPVKADSKEDDDKLYFTQKNQQMCIALKSALLNPLFRKVLEGLSDPEKRENLMAVCPELRADPTMFGILSDPDLLNAYIDFKNLKSVLQRYPYFLEVASHISASFLEESSSGNPFHLENMDRSSFYNYSIDAPSDDEMDDSDASSISSTNTQASSNRLTEHPSQNFASMLMRAYQQSNRNQQQQAARLQPPSTSNPLTPSSSGSNLVITPDMLRQALQTSATTPAAPAAAPAATTPAPQPASQQPSNPAPVAANQPTQPQRTTAQILIGYAPQLRQMRELGITDDIVAIQALEATNGDVQAALNIIFSDFN